MVSGEPTTICGNDSVVKKSCTVGLAPAGQALITDRKAGGGHRLLDGRVEHQLLGHGVRHQVPAQKLDDLAEYVGGLVGIPAVDLIGDCL